MQVTACVKRRQRVQKPRDAASKTRNSKGLRWLGYAEQHHITEYIPEGGVALPGSKSGANVQEDCLGTWENLQSPSLANRLKDSGNNPGFLLKWHTAGKRSDSSAQIEVPQGVNGIVDRKHKEDEKGCKKS